MQNLLGLFHSFNKENWGSWQTRSCLQLCFSCWGIYFLWIDKNASSGRDASSSLIQHPVLSDKSVVNYVHEWSRASHTNNHKQTSWGRVACQNKFAASQINMEFSSTSLPPVMFYPGRQWNKTVIFFSVLTVEKSFHLNHNCFDLVKHVFLKNP